MWKRASLIGDNVYGDFDLSESATIIYMALFLFAIIATAAQIVRHRKETPNRIGVTFLFMGTPILEVAGFAVRLASVLSPSNKGLYLANMIILGLGPLYLTAVNWFVFPALIMHVGTRYSYIKPWTFQFLVIILMISCIQLNTRGVVQAYNYSEDQSFRNGGSGTMLGGLGLTLCMWIIYAIFFAIFIFRYFRQHDTPVSDRVRAISVALFINIISLTIRYVYRIVEFSLLIHSGEELNELWLYIADAAPTFVGVMAFVLVLPYELPFAAVCKAMSRKGRGCGSTNTERQSEVVVDSSSASQKPEEVTV